MGEDFSESVNTSPNTVRGPTCDLTAVNQAEEKHLAHDDDSQEPKGPNGPEVTLTVKWSKDTYPIELPHDATVCDLKKRIFELTEVEPSRQKVMGLPKFQRKIPGNDVQLSGLKTKDYQSVLMIGSREKDIQRLIQGSENADVVDDLDELWTYTKEKGTRVVQDLHRAKEKLQRRIQTLSIQCMNRPREGKRLLVLDLDYTLFDCKGINGSVSDYGRPGLHTFLSEVYVHYDIVIWSQTSWRWLEAKITELGMVFNPHYHVCFVLDRRFMFPVTVSRGDSGNHTHEVKALDILWQNFPEQWSAKNTIHIDDLSRNFVMNPQCGLKISAYKNAQRNRQSDRELYVLKEYLKLIAEREKDFTKLDHRHWKTYLEKVNNGSTSS